MFLINTFDIESNTKIIKQNSSFIKNFFKANATISEDIVVQLKIVTKIFVKMRWEKQTRFCLRFYK